MSIYHQRPFSHALKGKITSSLVGLFVSQNPLTSSRMSNVSPLLIHRNQELHTAKEYGPRYRCGPTALLYTDITPRQQRCTQVYLVTSLPVDLPGQDGDTSFSARSSCQFYRFTTRALLPSVVLSHCYHSGASLLREST
jgi:hypothetical protein